MRRLNPDALERGGKPPPARKGALRRRPAPRWRQLAARAGAAAALLLALAGAGVWLWRSGIPAAAWRRIDDRILAASAEAGYRLRQVVVEGRQNTPRELLLARLGVHRGQPLLAIDPADMKARLAGLGWVRQVTVERRLPDELCIHITEAVPAAIWQQSGSFRLIDREGHVIDDSDVARFARLPVVVGEHAPEHTADLLAMLAREPDLASRVRAAVWVGERRWNLHFDNGVDVKLPADSPQAAWSLLARLQREQSLLARDVSVIDMRLPDRLVVRLGPAAQLQRQPGNDT
ncbi:MAG TPA: cell division protein FtsQ/DivIB [Dongiaceae bacterium]|nr:cell division protein FtsQ/DivIB [Dongiaceae bacterium]